MIERFFRSRILACAPFIWWSCLCLLYLQTPARAGEEGQEDLEMDIYFAPAETVTSASRHAQPLEQSPSAITVLTREDIEASGARTLPEALRLVPNMDIRLVKPLWYGVGVRRNSGPASDKVLLLVDSRDVTLEFFGFPAWTVQAFSMDDVERIEVIRGPGSALYGANAYAGVVNVITRAPGSEPRASFSLRGGERGQIEISLRSSEKIGALSLAAGAGLMRADLWSVRDTPGMNILRGQLSGRAPRFEDRFRLQLVQE